MSDLVNLIKKSIFTNIFSFEQKKRKIVQTFRFPNCRKVLKVIVKVVKVKLIRAVQRQEAITPFQLPRRGQLPNSLILIFIGQITG